MQTPTSKVVTRVTNPFPSESSLYFPVVERRDGWCDKHGNWHVDPSQKKLIRVGASMVDGDNVNPVILATVGASYKVILNSELFPYIEQRMTERLPRWMTHDVMVKEEVSYGGRDCYRHYIFPNFKIAINEHDSVSFRLIIGNSYGGKAVQLIAGAIDFYCTNGMIIGTYERTIRKHTTGLTVQGLDKWIDKSVTFFGGYCKSLQRWARWFIQPQQFDDVLASLVDSGIMSKRRAREFADATHKEVQYRADHPDCISLWQMYSALTQFATHGQIRETGNDHAANTRIERSKEANRIMIHVVKYLETE